MRRGTADCVEYREAAGAVALLNRTESKEEAAIWRPFKFGTGEGRVSAIISKPLRLSFDKNQKPRDEARRIAADFRIDGRRCGTNFPMSVSALSVRLPTLRHWISALR
jgi:hypothetical protein